MTQALIDDPLLADEVQPTKTVAEMVRADERLKRDFKLFTLPLLIIHGTKDTVTRPEGSKEFYANAGSKDKTLKMYEGYFHDPLSDIGKEAVMADIRGWIEAHLPVNPCCSNGSTRSTACSTRHAGALGDDFTAYRNHAYRVANFCMALAPGARCRARESGARRRLPRPRHLDRAHLRLSTAVDRARLRPPRLLGP